MKLGYVSGTHHLWKTEALWDVGGQGVAAAFLWWEPEQCALVTGKCLGDETDKAR